MSTSRVLVVVVAAACAGGRSTPTTPASAPAGPSAVAPAAPPAMAFAVDPGGATKQPVAQAIAILQPTVGNHVTGTVRFVDVEGRGLEVVAEVQGLSQQPHAYHVHVFGDCSAPDAESAGPHFHFTGSSFDKEVGIITGNLGQLQRQGEEMMVTHRARIEDASLQGEFSIIGRAVIVHERPNDPAVTPDGNAGGRIACGVIGVANPSTSQSAQR